MGLTYKIKLNKMTCVTILRTTGSSLQYLVGQITRIRSCSHRNTSLRDQSSVLVRWSRCNGTAETSHRYQSRSMDSTARQTTSTLDGTIMSRYFSSSLPTSSNTGSPSSTGTMVVKDTMAQHNLLGSTLKFQNLLLVIKQTAFEEYSQVGSNVT
jgi:hypothetical protein